MRTIVFLFAALGLTACGVADRLGLSVETSDRTQPYDAKLRAADDPRDFAVTVEAPAATVDEVRESVRFPATRYCIEKFGASDVDWAIDPATGDWRRQIDGADQIFTGRCLAR